MKNILAGFMIACGTLGLLWIFIVTIPSMKVNERTMKVVYHMYGQSHNDTISLTSSFIYIDKEHNNMLTIENNGLGAKEEIASSVEWFKVIENEGKNK